MVPISAPFAAFLLDRAARLRQGTAVQWAIDAGVVALGFARALYEVPFISGHALFLTYALLTVRSNLAKAIALVVLAQVIYLKLFAWHDNTLFGGIGLGLAAVGLFFLARPRAQNNPANA